MEIEPRYLCMSGKRFNFAIGTNPEPWVREPSEQKSENTVTNSLHKKKRVLYPIDTAADMSLGTSPSISTYGIRTISDKTRQTSDYQIVPRFFRVLSNRIQDRLNHYFSRKFLFLERPAESFDGISALE